MALDFYIVGFSPPGSLAPSPHAVDCPVWYDRMVCSLSSHGQDPFCGTPYFRPQALDAFLDRFFPPIIPTKLQPPRLPHNVLEPLRPTGVLRCDRTFPFLRSSFTFS